jgi:hypothetical protein
MGTSIMQDRDGNILMGYSATNGTLFREYAVMDGLPLSHLITFIWWHIGYRNWHITQQPPPPQFSDLAAQCCGDYSSMNIDWPEGTLFRNPFGSGPPQGHP